MWWLLAIWLLAARKQPRVSGPGDLYRAMQQRASGRDGHDHRGQGGRPSSRAPGARPTTFHEEATPRSGFGRPRSSHAIDTTPVQAQQKAPDPYAPQQPQYPYPQPWGMPQTQPQSWQDQQDAYADAYGDDGYEGFEEGQGEGEEMVATPGHWERARAGETPDTPDGMVWVDDS